MKIAFCVICKGTDKEANLLNNLLTSVKPYVDGIFVTVTQPNDRVIQVAEMYDATISHFDWTGDFSEARNFNFSQAPKEYDYIMWGDADDEFMGLEKLKEVMEEHVSDGYVMDYLYDHDKYGMPTVVHPKTQIVSNDGTFNWVGKIHEDLNANREISLMRFEGIKRIHKTTNERVKESSIRNKEISLNNQTGDPRDLWNLANAYTGTNEYEKAIKTFTKFIEVSGSEMERYMALLRVANMYLSLHEYGQAEEAARKAISIHFSYPDAFHTLAQIQKAQGLKKEAIVTSLEGLSKTPPIDTAIVYNPRDYDYNPLMTLADLYWDTSQFEKARTCLEACQEIQPQNKSLEDMIQAAEKERQLQEKMIALAQEMQKMTDEEFTAKYNSLSKEEQEYPLMRQTKNLRFIKTETSGKDLVYYCGETLPWTPETMKTKGVGGSEEAVINLTTQWAKAGYNVTVYNDCGEEKVYDGVTYKPWYTYNYRDKQDILVVWRQLRLLDYDLNVGKIFIDVHDVMSEGEFTVKRLAKVDKVFLKSEAHRELFPKVPDEKIVVIANGMDTSLFKQSTSSQCPYCKNKDLEEMPANKLPWKDDSYKHVRPLQYGNYCHQCTGISGFPHYKRDPYLIINTSSPDRALSALVRLFPKIKAKEPRAKMTWAYGFQVFDLVYKRDREKQAWKKTMERKMKEVGITNLGKISHPEIADLTLSAGIMLYPTHFMEIDCVSARKAQLAGTHVVCSDFGALKTTVKYGYKIPSPYTKDNWCPPYTFDLADDEERDDEYVEAVLKAFKNNEREEQRVWAKTFTPEYVANVWLTNF